MSFTTSRAGRNALADLSVPEYPGIAADVSRDDFWLDVETSDSKPAEWVAEWNEIVVDPEGETSHESRFMYGRFESLDAELQRLTERPGLDPTQPIQLDISAWALHYRTPVAA